MIERATSPKRAGLVLAALIAVAAVANLGLAVANVALPSIGEHFDASQTALDLVAVGYSLGLAASVLYFGAIGDRYGRKLLLVLGMALTIPADCSRRGRPRSACSSVPASLGGLAAGMAYPTTLALITALWSGAARTHAIALWAATGGAIAALGPLCRGSCWSTSGGARSSCSRCPWRSSRWRWPSSWSRHTSTRAPSRSTTSAASSRSRSSVRWSSRSTSRRCRTRRRWHSGSASSPS